MALPFVVSPYLRPIRRADGVLLIDNPIAGRCDGVSPLAEKVLGALWDDKTAEAALQDLCGQVEGGLAAVTEELLRLAQAQMLFADAASCDAALMARWEQELPEVPFIDQIELTNHCPMRCGFCPRGVPGRMVRAKGFLDLGLFVRLVDQLSPLQRFYRPLELHHLGESLLHKDLVSMVAYARDRGLPTELSANPGLLSPELSQGLLSAGIARLVLSLDGMSAQTLHTIRGPAARFDRVDGNLEALFGMLRQMPKPPTVVIQMIDLADNRHEQEAFLSRFANLQGLPTVQVLRKDLDGPDPATGRESAHPLRYLCGYPFRSVVVLWDGRVVPCCRDDDGRLILGDLTRQSLAEIWHGEAAQALREHHRRGTFEEGHLCTGCSWRKTHFAEAHPLRHPSLSKKDPLHW